VTGSHLCGLLEVEETGGDVNRSGQNEERSAPGRGVVGSRSEGAEPASGQAAEDPEAQPVGLNGKRVIRQKQRAVTAAASGVKAVGHG
jgi:hypothetical protein